MNSEKKGIWQIRLAILSIFLLGFVAGAFALHSYHLWFSTAAEPTKADKFRRVFNELGMTEAQKAEVDKIVSDTREKLHRLRQESEPQVQEIRAEHDEKLQRVLTPEQWQRFQQEREKIREAEKHSSGQKKLVMR